MIYLGNPDNPWRGNFRMHLSYWRVKDHTIILAGISKTVNMCKSPSSFPIQTLWGSESQREGILPEELVIDAPVHLWSLLIYISLKEENRGRVSTECCRLLFSQSLSLPPFPLSLSENGLSLTPLLSLSLPSLANTLLPWKERKGSQEAVSAQCKFSGMALWRFSQFLRLVSLPA